jgi:hypothetical protein
LNIIYSLGNMNAMGSHANYDVNWFHTSIRNNLIIN